MSKKISISSIEKLDLSDLDDNLDNLYKKAYDMLREYICDSNRCCYFCGCGCWLGEDGHDEDCEAMNLINKIDMINNKNHYKYVESILHHIIKGKSNSINVYMDYSCKMSSVTLNGSIIYEGNFWDYHPGCHDIYEFEFGNPRQFADKLSEYLIIKYGRDYPDTNYIINTKDYTWKDGDYELE